MDNQSKFQRRTALILTALFFAGIFFLFIATMVTKGNKLVSSLRYFKAKAYLEDEEDPDFFEMTKARIASLDAAASENLFMSDELGYFSATFQYSIGKRITNIGDAAMLKTDGGYLYDITGKYDFTQSAGEIVTLRDSLAGKIPFLFVYEHALGFGETDADEIPAGYVDLDYSYENGDEILKILEAAGVETLDSRTIFGETGRTKEELMMRTDHHWTTLGDLLMAQSVAAKLAEITGVNLDLSLLQVDQFETETYPSILLGQRGERIGAFNTKLDDVTLYYPRYATSIRRETLFNQDAELEVQSGSFHDAVIRWDSMERDETGYNTTANRAYSFTGAYDRFENANAAPLRVLVLKDSYSGQVASFLSLVASDVILVDLRKEDEDAMYFIQKYQPDVVVVGYCQQMMMEHKYTMIAGNS